jgi:ADP-ribose pyrophosphatase
MDRIERRRERIAYQNPFVVVYDDDVVFADGHQGTYIRVTPRGSGLGVVVVPRRLDSSRAPTYGLVRTYRYPVGGFQWAFPRGFAQGPDAEATARAELHEELGATASAWTVLGHLTPDSGVQSTRVVVFLADIAAVGEPTDLREVSETRWVTAQALRAMVSAGEIEDAFTLAAMLMTSLAGPSS